MAYRQHLAPDSPAVMSYYDFRTAKEHAAYLVPHLQPHFKILDVGCGPGNITHDLARLVPQGSAMGVDMSPGAVEAANARYKEPNLSYKVADATGLSAFADNSFDVVHAHCVLMHIPDAITALKEMHRVLVPNGIMATRDISAGIFSIRPSYPPFDKLMTDYVPVAEGFLEAAGSCSRAGLHKRTWAVAAGFDEARISEQKSYEYLRDVGRLWRAPAKARFVDLGLATEEQVEEWDRIWALWAKLPVEEREGIKEYVDMLYFKPRRS
ncbi:unnamed protein product [Discula destructiva]